MERTVVADVSWPDKASPEPPGPRSGQSPASLAAGAKDAAGIDLFADPLPASAHAGPLTAHAAPVLLALSRLHLGAAAASPAALRDGFTAAIRAFESAALGAGASAERVRVARLALCETVDDVVGHLPGQNPAAWRERGVQAMTLGRGNGGAGFFAAVNELLGEPAPDGELLTLLHACLALGFEGQYRGRPGGAEDLDRVRTDIFDALKNHGVLVPEVAPALVAPAPARFRPATPWVLGVLAAVLLAGLYAGLRWQLERESQALAQALLAINPSSPDGVARGTAEDAPASTTPALPDEPDPPPAQNLLDHVSEALAELVAQGGISVASSGDAVVIEVNNALAFAPGSAEPKSEFDLVADRLAAALEPFKGTVGIVGHTDNVKPRANSAFKSNEELSLARARAVEQLLSTRLGDGVRFQPEGRGEAEPIADNGTAEGRARNRRIILMVPAGASP